MQTDAFGKPEYFASEIFEPGLFNNEALMRPINVSMPGFSPNV
jgi:hypothetical protein